jgi:ATP-dependent Zn protease
MVFRLGMGSENGLLVHDDQSAPLSGEAQARMDAEVNAMLQRLYGDTREILTRHQPALKALAEALLDRETIDGEEALDILRSSGAPV